MPTITCEDAKCKYNDLGFCTITKNVYMMKLPGGHTICGSRTYIIKPVVKS